MAERGSFGICPRLDFQQLMVEAQHRWLRPAEICEILRNYQKFHITPEPPSRPPSGSLFLFDRKVLRYFRKDGHNWRKKKDGKTVKEAHEKLKVGSIDVLHCYYAHGEENENFQRRSYWLLEEDFMHIVFVHYLEVKGSKTNIGGIRTPSEGITRFQDSPLSSGRLTNQSTTNSGNTDSTSPTSSLTSLCEDADSEDVHQASPRLQRFIEASHAKNGSSVDNTTAGPSSLHIMPPSLGNPEGFSSIAGPKHTSFVQGDRFNYDVGRTYMNECQRLNNTESWEGAWGQCSTGFLTIPSHLSKPYIKPSSGQIASEQEYMLSSKVLSGEEAGRHVSGEPSSVQSNWQLAFENDQLQLPKWPVDQTLNSGFTYDLGPELSEQSTHDSTLQNSPDAYYSFDQQSDQSVLGMAESQWLVDSNFDTDFLVEGNGNYARKLLLEGDEGLQKVDSFSRWISKELGDVEDLHVQSTSDISWSAVECGDVNNESSLSPSLSQDQLFSIIDFSPKWAYTDSETEVFIIGTFLKSELEVKKCKWSCMFGELEVLAEVLADGILCCHVPSHEAGQVPFYITCSNRLACSEVREFEYQEGSPRDIDSTNVCSDDESGLVRLQLKRLLSLKSVSPRKNAFKEGPTETRAIMMKILSLKDEEGCCQTLEHHSENDLKIQPCERFVKEKFYSWLLHKITEDGKGPSVLDDKGQSVIHVTAALGYDWAIEPIVAAGVSINFRDINGWTALHWAAFCGRERTVAVLVYLGAAPGLLTDPSPEYPLGRTPADLASGNGHKGISGFLAETSLTDYFSSLKMKEPNEDGSAEESGAKAVLTVAEKAATPIGAGDMPEALSLKDSLTAVCNAKQAADRIHLVFRMQSFQRKRVECDFDEYEDEQAISVLASKTRKPGQNDWLAHAAATQIQKKYRGWKKRKEFLIIRQRIIKIQAHVRGHQVRKQYKTIIWSVGILEKIILRWRRRGSGLRGFRQDNKDHKPQAVTSKEDDYDFLKEGKKQTEERLQKALTRVKSMVQYPEARDQYRRLLTVVEGIRETKACNMVLNSPEEVPDGEEDMIDIGPLLDDDAFMSMAFE